MKKIIIIYDDSLKPNKEVMTITGDKTYGQTIFKRVTLKDRLETVMCANKNVLKVMSYTSPSDFTEIQKVLTGLEENVAVLYLYSNYALRDTEEFKSLLVKAEFITEDYQAVCEGKTALALLNTQTSFLEQVDALQNRVFEACKIETNAFMDLSKLSNFLTFITSGFDARFFNALAGDEYTVTKKSSKIEKIKAEYQFYYLLPDPMKMWFVMPYNYQETKEYATYTMERFHMTDIAIRFVHQAVSIDEMKDILDKLFYFLKIRATKKVTKEEAKQVCDELYLEKLRARIADLKKLPEYEQFDHMIAMGTKYDSLAAVIQKYETLYEASERKGKNNAELVVGHGDLCFSNILYSKEANILKLIDPKGALKEEDLYTDPYYDLAKLSHSICGCYDFFNSGLYQISVDRDMKINLSIDTDKAPYIALFKQYLEKNKYDYNLVRLYEASLFLSMLPYHMDQPGKVFGFILNAIKILEEVSACTKE